MAISSSQTEIASSPRLLCAPRNDSEHCQFDLQWDDADLFPEVVYPDADFMFTRMNEVTVEMVNAREGETILDIGCGRAIDGIEMAKAGALVIGLEPSTWMLRRANERIGKNSANMSLVRGVGEYLPLQKACLDKVVCKGALDHFVEPAAVVEQVAAVLKRDGAAVIAIANFQSLGFRLGRAIWFLWRKLGFKPEAGRMPWEMPPDHVHKFDYSILRRLINGRLEVERTSGVSLLFGLPWWGLFLSRCPRSMSLGILSVLDKVARYLPRLSDVIVLRCRPKPHGGNNQTLDCSLRA